jgi:hypothetical protein
LPKIRLATGPAWGSNACTRARACSSLPMSGMAGASRMSSVRGLNDKPQTAIVLFLSDPKCVSSFETKRTFCASLTRSTALRV